MPLSDVQGDGEAIVKRPRVKRRSSTRIVCYGWSLPDPREEACNVRGIFDEAAMDKLLDAARAAGTISMGDAGRGAVVWFEGQPGAELRALKAQVLAMLPAGVVSLATQRRSAARSGRELRRPT